MFHLGSMDIPHEIQSGPVLALLKAVSIPVISLQISPNMVFSISSVSVGFLWGFALGLRENEEVSGSSGFLAI